jgi:hypothetical protein
VVALWRFDGGSTTQAPSQGRRCWTALVLRRTSNTKGKLMRAHVLVSMLVAGLLTTASSFPVSAQTAPPTRIRGTIASVGAHTVTVKTRGGEMRDITLTEPLSVLTVKKVDLASIKTGDYVGIATRNGTGGSMEAIEVLVFPEAARGSGEGSYPWDVEPGSKMTNGTVNGAVKATSALQLTVGYKDGSQTIQVSPSAPVVTFAPADKTDLKVGAPVFLGAVKSPEGTFSAGRVVVGKDGVAPPM